MIVRDLLPLSKPIDKFTPDPANARKHDDKSYEVIANSLRQFGQRTAIVAQEKDGQWIVRKGNGTLEAAKRLGWTEIAAVIVNEDSVVATAYAIADNKTAEVSTWDDEVLNKTLRALVDEGVHVDDFGFDFSQIETPSFETETKEEEEKETDDEEEEPLDDIPEKVEPVAKTGDVLTAGDATLYVGDCLDSLKLLPDNSVDALVSDPPYFLTGSTGSGFMGKSWDSLSPVSAIVESLFKSMKLVLDMGEASTVLKNANIKKYENNAKSAQTQLIQQQQDFAHLLVLTKQEALVLCKELLPSLISRVENLPSHAIFVGQSLPIRINTPKSIARTIADILCEDPAWLEKTTTFISTVKIEKENCFIEEKSGTLSERKFTNEITTLAENVNPNVVDSISSATTSNHTDLDKITNKITSSPYAKNVIKQCMEIQSFIPTLSEAFHYKWGREVYRVLKPGAHGLVFSGTRTYHRMVSALEDVGYEVRDCCVWIYGSGFPKSLDISKAIDKAAGAERVDLGPSQYADKGRTANNNTYGRPTASNTERLTLPATPEAKLWQGWGTALKPSQEPIVLIRKPISEKTVAANVLKWGCGGINIDASRIGNENLSKEWDRRWNDNNGEFGGRYSQESRESGKQVPNGRFPANLVLSHNPDCVLVGEKKVSAGGGKPVNVDPTKSMLGIGANSTYYGGKDGTETVEAWECTEGCAVAELDRQQEQVSRFFYCSKPSKRERNAGLEGMPEKIVQISGQGAACPKMTKDGVPNKDIINQNHHPTVKPIKLMQYLATMITPPGGTIIDCFNGSGTTGLAALSKGFKYIGMEKELEYADIAIARWKAFVDKKTEKES